MTLSKSNFRCSIISGAKEYILYHSQRTDSPPPPSSSVWSTLPVSQPLSALSAVNSQITYTLKMRKRNLVGAVRSKGDTRIYSLSGANGVDGLYYNTKIHGSLLVTWSSPTVHLYRSLTNYYLRFLTSVQKTKCDNK